MLLRVTSITCPSLRELSAREADIFRMDPDREKGREVGSVKDSD